MKQIVITDTIIGYSYQYYADLIRPGFGRYKTAKSRLTDFEAEIRAITGWTDYADYIKEIIRLYSIIIRLRPEYFGLFHQRYFSKWNHLNLSRQYKHLPFYKVLVERMRYQDVRSTFLLPYILKMGIKTCVYCNAQYAATMLSPNGSYATYELDHYYPQSVYPYLSTSFFNLNPCCPSCNKIKSKGLIGMYPLYVRDYSQKLRFELTKASIVKYCLNGDASELEIKLMDTKPCTPSYASEYDRSFRISKLYSTHQDEAEELVWKSKIYNDSYRSQLLSSFQKLFPNNVSDFSRLLIGMSKKESDILKRPLTKMKQDIARQLKLIK